MWRGCCRSHRVNGAQNGGFLVPSASALSTVSLSHLSLLDTAQHNSEFLLLIWVGTCGAIVFSETLQRHACLLRASSAFESLAVGAPKTQQTAEMGGHEGRLLNSETQGSMNHARARAEGYQKASAKSHPSVWCIFPLSHWEGPKPQSWLYPVMLQQNKHLGLTERQEESSSCFEPLQIPPPQTPSYTCWWTKSIPNSGPTS